MTASEVLVQLDAIEAMERGIVGARQSVARSLRTIRVDAGLSLRDVAPHVHCTAATLSNIERGTTFRSKTVRQIAIWYNKHLAA